MILVKWSDDIASTLESAAGDKSSLDYIKNEVVSGTAKLWQFFDDKFDGYVVTRTERNSHGKELVIVVGSGFGAKYFIEFIKCYARITCHDTIRTHVKRAGLMRIYERAGFAFVGVDSDGYNILRLKNGR